MIALDYTIVGKQVVTVDKQKVGKVSDFATEVETMMVQKIYVSQSILKSFAGGSLSIDRSQVVETTPKKIVINDLLKDSRVPAAAAAS